MNSIRLTFPLIERYLLAKEFAMSCGVSDVRLTEAFGSGRWREVVRAKMKDTPCPFHTRLCGLPARSRGSARYFFVGFVLTSMKLGDATRRSCILGSWNRPPEARAARKKIKKYSVDQHCYENLTLLFHKSWTENHFSLFNAPKPCSTAAADEEL